MAEATYYVALPFAASDDGVAACEPTECFNPIAALYVGYVSSERCCDVNACGDDCPHLKTSTDSL